MSNLTGAVVRVIKDDIQVVIDKGSCDGVELGQRFLIYGIDPEPIIHPITGENLGSLEIVRGTGKVVHVQEGLATNESDKFSTPKKKVSTIINHSPFTDKFGTKERSEEIIEDSEQLPFEYPAVGDFAKRI